VLGRRVGPRARTAITRELAAGGSVVVGGFAMSAVGIAVAKKPDRVVPWSDVTLSFAQDLGMHVQGATVSLSASISEPDAYLLPDLIPELRARFG
jgi:hypothetical protein